MTSPLVTLAQAKAHLRVTQSSEDSTIQLYCDAATSYIRKYLNRSIPGEQGGETTPPEIVAAALLLIGGMYQNRSDIIDGRFGINIAVQNMLFPYRVNLGM